MLKNPVSITPDKTVDDAIDLMHDRRVDTLLVTDADGVLQGYVDLDDINRITDATTPVSRFTNKEVFYVQASALIGDTVDRILKQGVKNVPVVDAKKHLVGIVTRTALVDIVYDALRGAPASDEQPASPINADIHAAATHEGGESSQ